MATETKDTEKMLIGSLDVDLDEMWDGLNPKSGVNDTLDFRYTALIYAIDTRQLKLLQALLKTISLPNGCDVNARSSINTPLGTAISRLAFYNDKSFNAWIMQTLLDAGAKLDVPTDLGDNPAMGRSVKQMPLDKLLDRHRKLINTLLGQRSKESPMELCSLAEKIFLARVVSEASKYVLSFHAIENYIFPVAIGAIITEYSIDPDYISTLTKYAATDFAGHKTFLQNLAKLCVQCSIDITYNPPKLVTLEDEIASNEPLPGDLIIPMSKDIKSMKETIAKQSKIIDEQSDKISEQNQILNEQSKLIEMFKHQLSTMEKNMEQVLSHIGLSPIGLTPPQNKPVVVFSFNGASKGTNTSISTVNSTANNATHGTNNESAHSTEHNKKAVNGSKNA